jgi:hypothetical protein
MESSVHFRNKAEECRTLAAQAKTESTRLSLLRAAANYDSIAETCEQIERAKADTSNPPTPAAKK